MRQIFLAIWLAGLAVGLAGCGGLADGGAKTPALEPADGPGALRYYRTPTATARLATATPRLAAPTLTPMPSATPFTHIVQQGETMLGIALRYGVQVNELQAANPGVDARMLSVGKSLVIPLSGPAAALPATPTPAPAGLGETVCYPDLTGGAWCLVDIINEGELALENLAVWVGLYGPDGELLGGQTVFPALNRLAAGQRLPAAAYFPGPLPAGAWGRSELAAALAVAAGDGRYLEVQVEAAPSVSLDGRTVSVVGTVRWTAEAPPGSVWVAAAAYDAFGRPVGVRKWQAGSVCPPAADAASGAGCAQTAFELWVYSLGPAAVQVNVLAEARP